MTVLRTILIFYSNERCLQSLFHSVSFLSSFFVSLPLSLPEAKHGLCRSCTSTENSLNRCKKLRDGGKGRNEREARSFQLRCSRTSAQWHGADTQQWLVNFPALHKTQRQNLNQLNAVINSILQPPLTIRCRELVLQMDESTSSQLFLAQILFLFRVADCLCSRSSSARDLTS